MKQPLVIYAYGGGRLANQLLNFSHLIGWSAENEGKIAVCSIPFWPYASLFSGTKSNRLCRFPNSPLLDSRSGSLVSNLLNKTATKLLQLDPLGGGEKVVKGFVDLAGFFSLPVIRNKFPEIVELNNVSLRKNIIANQVTVFAGWGFRRNWSLVQKHQNVIRQFFRPREELCHKADLFIANAREKCDYLVGVLIRQTDYSKWKAGKYYFLTDDYVNWMHEVNSWFPGKKVGFIITSDEQQDEKKFNGLNCWLATGSKQVGGHYLESIVELAACDIVMSPPSTFGAWAAFMGNKPLLPLSVKHDQLEEKMLLYQHLFDAQRHPFFGDSVN